MSSLHALTFQFTILINLIIILLFTIPSRFANFTFYDFIPMYLTLTVINLTTHKAQFVMNLNFKYFVQVYYCLSSTIHLTQKAVCSQKLIRHAIHAHSE